MGPLVQMNKFEITDMPGMNTLGFLVNKNEENLAKGLPVFSLEKIEHVDVNENGAIKKSFNVIRNDEEKQLIVLVTLTGKKAILSTGELDAEGFTVTESNIPLNYGTIFNTEGIEYKEMAYNSEMKRNFTIIDTQTGDEVTPSIYLDPITGDVRGSCKILPHRPYVILEIAYDDAEDEE